MVICEAGWVARGESTVSPDFSRQINIDKREKNIVTKVRPAPGSAQSRLALVVFEIAMKKTLNLLFWKTTYIKNPIDPTQPQLEV